MSAEGEVRCRPEPGVCKSIGWMSLLAVVCLSAILSFPQEVAQLNPGTTLERELKGGEAHSFEVSLSAGQFLQIVVEQKGIDVEVILFGPNGERRSHMDSPNGLWGPEPILDVADQSGIYRVQVDSPTKGAPAGRYEINVVTLREAAPADREHVGAERLLEQGQDVSSQGSADALRAAIAKLNQALPYYLTSEDRYGRALVFFNLGAVYAQLSEFRNALDVYAQALPQFRGLGETRMEGSTLNNMGGAYDVLGDLHQALDFYNRALAVERSVGDSLTEASTLNNIGKICADLADWQKAIEYYDQVLPLWHAFGDLGGEAVTLHNIGTNYLDLGEPETGLDYLQRALSKSQAAGDKRLQATSLEDVGEAYLALGQVPQALQSYEQALALRYAVGDQWRAGLTLRKLGMAYSFQGDQEKALSSLQKALELLKTAEDRRTQGITLQNIGQVYGLMNQPPKAIEYQKQALELLEQVGDLDQEAKTHQGLARAERDSGNLAEARKQIETALFLVEKVRAQAGAQQQRASYFASQQGIYEFYIDLLMRLHQQDPNAGYDAQAFEASERARARSLLEMLAEAHVDFRQGVDVTLLERERNLSELLNSKAQRLLEAGPETPQATALKKEIGDLQAEYEQVEVRIRKTSSGYAAITQPQPLSTQDIQQQVLDSDTMLLEYALGAERSYLWAVSNNGFKSYELPKRSDIEQSVREVYELLTTRSTYTRGEFAPQRQRRIAKADAQLPEAAAKLSQMVLGPVAPELGKKRLALVTDGSLQHVPFAMLPIPGSAAPAVPLVVEHEIVNLPSASTLPILRQEIEGRKPAPGMLAVLADPVFGADDIRVKSGTAAVAKKQRAPVLVHDSSRVLEHLSPDAGAPVDENGHLRVPRLPFTRAEAERILKAAPGKDNLEALDFRASLALATSPELGRYRYLHFATHGYLDSERPGLSAIVLSLVDERGHPRAGFLRANEIYNLKLPAELVVLSACQTGLGKEIRGEGIVGLTRGFMYAGVPRVVVSLWSVNDRATAELMAKFYEKLLKGNLRPSAALREAQMEMLKQNAWSAPYYWAAFVQQGEWK
jgi:CHAT domain-containing protein